MVEAEEAKEKARADAIHEQEDRDRKAGKIHHKKKKEHKETDNKNSDGKNEAGKKNEGKKD